MEHAGVGALFDEVGDLLLRGRGLHVLAEPEDFQHRIGGEGEEPDDGGGEHGQTGHRFGDEHGPALGIAQRDALGHEFADDEREIGDDRHDKAEAQGLGERGGHAEALQP